MTTPLRSRFLRAAPCAVTLLALMLMASCTTLGPTSVQRDRFDYNAAVSDSWKDQTLLNIVKLRYADMPLFIEVSSIVSGYTLEQLVNLTGTVVEGSLPNAGTLGAQAKYIDRPTITYQPITGGQFNKTFLKPIPPSAILFLIQAGWPADIVLPITVEAINGLHAPRNVGARMQEGDSEYDRVIELLAGIQRAGALGMRVEHTDEDEMDSTLMMIRRDRVPPEVEDARSELAELLKLDREALEYTIAYGEVASEDDELAMLTRSILSIMIELAGEVRVPPEHIEDGRVPAALADLDPTAPHRLIDIRSSEDRPDDAFVMIRYDEHWFWIDHSDYASKRTFAYLMLLFSLTESGTDQGLPLVTIPAG